MYRDDCILIIRRVQCRRRCQDWDHRETEGNILQGARQSGSNLVWSGDYVSKMAEKLRAREYVWKPMSMCLYKCYMFICLLLVCVDTFCVWQSISACPSADDHEVAIVIWGLTSLWKVTMGSEGRGPGRRDATGASERRVCSEQKGTWFTNRLQASKNSARPGVSAHWMGVKFHSNDNGERLYETSAWNLGWRVNYSWYSALTWDVKQTQNGPKPSLPSRLFYPEADLAAVNNARMLYLKKMDSSWTYLLTATGRSSCLWARRLFFSYCSLQTIEISWGEIEQSDSCHRAIKSNISPPCEATTAEMENESEAPFSLNSIEPLTFSDFKSWDASETEMTPIANKSAFIRLQMEISSGMISKRVTQCNT